jgi:hypothetical protein
MLSAIMLNAVKLSAIMPSVVAPFLQPSQNFWDDNLSVTVHPQKMANLKKGNAD